MKLSIYRESRPGDQHLASEQGVLPDNFELRLTPSHPVLELDATDTAAMLDKPSGSEVLHVKVRREIKPGVFQYAHLHFSIGLNNQDQLVGEVTAMLGDQPPTRKKAVARWRSPANPDAAKDEN